MGKRGIPYSLNEAKILVQDQGHRIDPYHKELMEFLVKQNEELAHSLHDMLYKITPDGGMETSDMLDRAKRVLAEAGGGNQRAENAHSA